MPSIRSLNALFEPDVLLPGQFAAQRRSITPEHALMLAVVEVALAALGSQNAMIRTDAWRWLESGDASWPFSFGAICDTLGWGAEAVRSGVLAMLERPAEWNRRFSRRR